MIIMAETKDKITRSVNSGEYAHKEGGTLLRDEKKKEKAAQKEKRKPEPEAEMKKEEKKIEPKKEEKKFKSNFKFSAERDPWKILQHPVLTEKNIRAVETENKLAFIVRREANKTQIKWAVESALSVRIEKINTLIDRNGKKKAIVKLAPEFNGVDIATRF